MCQHSSHLVQAVRSINLERFRSIGSARSHNHVFRAELDSHADTCVVGNRALVLSEHPRQVMVSGYDPSQPARQATIVDAAIKYRARDTGDDMIIVVNQAILIPEVDHCLLCPMQCRMNGVRVSETPKFLCENPTNSDHAISLLDPLTEDPIVIPLMLQGVVSYFEYSTPTAAEVEDETLLHVELTAQSPEWDPYDDTLAAQEAGTLDWRGMCIASARSDTLWRQAVGTGALADAGIDGEPHWKYSQVSLQQVAVDVTDDDNFGLALEANVQVALTRTCDSPERYNVSRVYTGKRRGAVDHITLANRWGISIEKAKNTVKRTTQLGVRTVLHPSLSRRFRTNDRMLRYRRFQHNLYSDTMFSSVKSARGNTCAQIFATDFGWSRSYPMPSKGKAHEALSLLFAREGAPPRLIADNAKEMMLGEFAKKCKDASVHLRGTEPYSPWMNSAEREIRELKKGAGRKLVKPSAPLTLWDDSLELESYIRSNTSHDIFKLEGRVPETLMSGETSDISPFCEFAFYDWVMFRDQGVAFPGDPRTLGKYLGPSIDVGPAMTAKILKENGQVVDRSTLRRLTPAELIDADHCRRRDEFLEKIKSKLGPPAELADLGPDKLNLVQEPDTHEPWEDEDGPSFPELEEELEAAEAVGDFYVNAEVMLPTPTGEEERARVVKRKRDHEGTPIGQANRNPLLDTRLYEV